jgi:hypothetical protein
MVPAVLGKGWSGVETEVPAMRTWLVTVGIADGDNWAAHAGHELAPSGTDRVQTGQRTRKSSHE